MKIADNYKEIISLWNDNYEEMVGEYRISWEGMEYPYKHEYNFFNAIIQLENEDWNKATALIGKYKSKKLEYLMEYKTKWENEVRDKEQNQIFFSIKYIAPAFINFYQFVEEALGVDKSPRNITPRREEMENAFENAFHSQYFELLEIYQNVLKEYWRYWKMKKLLSQVQPKFDLFSISLNEGSSLEQLSKSNFKIDKALQELQERNEKAKLENLLKREDMPHLFH